MNPFATATELLADLRAGKVTSSDLTEMYIKRIEQYDGRLNAVVVRDFDRARQQARAADQGGSGALRGLPITLKESFNVSGLRTTCGVPEWKDFVSQHDSPAWARLRAAGAVLMGKTNVPPMLADWQSANPVYGRANNPWDLGRTPGGSSGGSAAALAAGLTALEVGSDIGGSIRVPASFNGVVGFKPPYGRVPQDAPFNLDTYCHCGPMARTVADCALLENVIAGPDPADVVSLRPKLVLPERLDGIDGTRIALSVDLGDWPVDPEVRANTLAAADALRAAGATVDLVELTLPRAHVRRAAAIHFDAIFGRWIAAEVAAHPDLITPYAAAFGPAIAALAAGGSMLDGLALEAELYAPVAALLEEYAALVCPTVGTRGLRAGDDYRDGGLEVAGARLDSYGESMLTLPFNIMSRCPVLAVPSGFADNGVPTGVQIVGRTYDDETVFRIGAALERERPWFDVPERRPALA
jgi:Asp-tRNA(Asn)/Glu-tRNA(Gln) amidotransferase A subunit family amidase